jgi:hypothetical protein
MSDSLFGTSVPPRPPDATFIVRGLQCSVVVPHRCGRRCGSPPAARSDRGGGARRRAVGRGGAPVSPARCACHRGVGPTDCGRAAGAGRGGGAPLVAGGGGAADRPRGGGMSDDPRHLTTDEQRERFAAAKERGGLCAGCGRILGEREPVYIEQVAIERKALAAGGAGWGKATTYRDAPLCEGCTSATFLSRARGRPPEACVGCGRPVYYAKLRAGRQRASCSHRCSNRVNRPARMGRP